MSAMLKSQLLSVYRQKTRKVGKGKEKTGISKYLSEDTGSEDEDEFDNNDDGDDTFQGFSKTIVQNDKEQLIDLELVNLLKYCSELYNKHKNDNENY